MRLRISKPRCSIDRPKLPFPICRHDWQMLNDLDKQRNLDLQPTFKERRIILIMMANSEYELSANNKMSMFHRVTLFFRSYGANRDQAVTRLMMD